MTTKACKVARCWHHRPFVRPKRCCFRWDCTAPMPQVCSEPKVRVLSGILVAIKAWTKHDDSWLLWICRRVGVFSHASYGRQTVKPSDFPIGTWRWLGNAKKPPKTQDVERPAKAVEVAVIVTHTILVGNLLAVDLPKDLQLLTDGG